MLRRSARRTRWTVLTIAGGNKTVILWLAPIVVLIMTRYLEMSKRRPP